VTVDTKSAAIDLDSSLVKPCVAAIYQLDGIVRRSPSLQATADGQAAISSAGAHA
jgi:NADH-quinone oxidoreductase subunit G